MTTTTPYKPLVSIITPSYNQGHFIRATIESVLQQDYDNVEYIVVDGASTDTTRSILEEYGDRIRWISEADNGQTDAINKGIRMSHGDIIAYLNSDDLYLPGTLSRIVSEFGENPEIKFLYGDLYAIDRDGKLLSKIKTIPFDPDILLYDANFISQPASFYRRTLFDTIGEFDDSLHYLMDYEFFLRAASRKVGIRLVRNYLSAIRYHDECKTVNGMEPWAEERRIIKLHYYEKPRTDSELRRLSILYRLKRYLLMIGRGRLDFAGLVLSYRRRQLSGSRRKKQ